ncbi:hypothetical protein [Methanoculleus sp. 10]|uniref:hypothetical protein n=1 Tax=Methanoculleus sp. 10 TaxID=430615 RepID=UPI0025DE5409|nr:hypothetical protein [Methanoculleus sp. 10]
MVIVMCNSATQDIKFYRNSTGYGGQVQSVEYRMQGDECKDMGRSMGYEEERERRRETGERNTKRGRDEGKVCEGWDPWIFRRDSPLWCSILIPLSPHPGGVFREFSPPLVRLPVIPSNDIPGWALLL